jgi:anthranilate phosphoribosyltransferase
MSVDPVLSPLTDKLRARTATAQGEAAAAARRLADPAVSDVARVDFLRAFSEKGETAAEVAEFASVFRELSRRPPVEAFAGKAIDIVGTGGDNANTFNISTITAIIVSAAGVPVMKHGGRSVSSKSGSADFLERLGVNLQVDDATHARALAENGFTFFFAPEFHPAFKSVGPARKALAAEGLKSVFNLLGPLINPGRPAHMMLGVYSEAWVAPLAEVLEKLGVRRALVVHGTAPGGVALDELSVCGPCRVKGVGELRTVDGVWEPGDFGLPVSPFSDLAGGDADENLGLLQDLLNGAAPQGLQDSIVFNVGTALWIAGRAPSVRDGIILAGDLFEHGAVREQLRRIRAFYTA